MWCRLSFPICSYMLGLLSRQWTKYWINLQWSLLGLSIWSHQMKDGIFCRVLVRNQNFQKVLVYRFRTLKLLPMIKLHSKLREYLFRHTSALWSAMVKLWLEHSFSEFFNISSNLKKMNNFKLCDLWFAIVF